MKNLLAFILLTFGLVANSWAGDFNLQTVDQPNVKWHFKHLNSFSTDDTTRVLGRLTAMNRINLPRGHVDLAAYDSNGKKIAETVANYTPNILTRRAMRKGGVRFYATFDQILPPETVIKIAFHVNESRLSNNPSHDMNIAK